MAMEETLKKLDQMGPAALDELKRWVESTTDFMSTQVPLVVDEIITWGLAKYIFATVICLPFLILLIHTLKTRSKVDWEDSSGYGQPTGSQVFWVIKAVLGLAGSIIFCVHVYHALFVWFAPRLYVLEVLSDLVKSKGT